MATKFITVVIIDDNDIYREGLVRVLQNHHEFQILLATGDVDLAAGEVQRLQPDIVIFCLQGANSPRVISLMRMMYRCIPAISLLAVLSYLNDADIVSALNAGAKGLIVRSAGTVELINALKQVMLTGHYYSQRVIGRVVAMIDTDSLKDLPLFKAKRLTEKDKLFMQLLCEERPFKDIANKMAVTVSCVQRRKQRLFYLTNQNSLTGLIKYAIVNGIYDPYRDITEALNRRAI